MVLIWLRQYIFFLNFCEAGLGKRRGLVYISTNLPPRLPKPASPGLLQLPLEDNWRLNLQTMRTHRTVQDTSALIPDCLNHLIRRPNRYPVPDV